MFPSDTFVRQIVSDAAEPPRKSLLPAIHILLELLGIGAFQFIGGDAVAEQDIVVVHEDVRHFLNQVSLRSAGSAAALAPPCFLTMSITSPTSPIIQSSLFCPISGQTASLVLVFLLQCFLHCLHFVDAEISHVFHLGLCKRPTSARQTRLRAERISAASQTGGRLPE